MSSLLVRGGTLWTGRELFPRGAVWAEDGEIRFAGDVRDLPAEARGVSVDATGGVVIPGLVNLHTHAAMTLLRTAAEDLPLMRWLKERIWPAEARLEPGDVRVGAQLACMELLASGTTLMCDMYLGMDEVAEAASSAGIRAVLARGLADVDPEAGERSLAESEAFFLRWHGAAEGRIQVMLGPHAPYTCSPGYLRRVADLAGRLGAGVHIHISETAEEVESTRAAHGMTPVELLVATGLDHCRLLLAHVTHPTLADDAILAGLTGGVAHCPVSNLKLAAGIAPVVRLRQHGVRVGLGTDGAGSATNLDLFETIRLAALLAKVSTGDAGALGAGEVLSMATLEGAAILGLEDRIGSLEPGKRCDLAVVSLDRPGLDPACDILSLVAHGVSGQDVVTTVCDGRIVYDHGRFPGLDPGAVREAARHIQARLTR